MLRSSLTILLAGCAFLASPAAAAAHGGTYVGPGDVVPPGGPPGNPPTPPQPVPPGNPPGTPGDLPGPGKPTSPPTNPPPRGPGGEPSWTPPSGGLEGADHAAWQTWWELNKHGFLNLRAKVHSGAATSDPSTLGLLGAARKAPRAPHEGQILAEVLPALHEAVAAETDRDILSGTMIALARIGRDDGRAAALFREHLDSPVQEINETATLAHGILGDESAFESVLVHLIADDAEGRRLTGEGETPLRIRAFAAYAAGLLGGASRDEDFRGRVLGRLLDTLEQDRSAAQDLRVAAAVAIGLIRPREAATAGPALDRLLRLLREARQDELVLAHVPNAMAKLLRGLPCEERALRDRALDATLALLAPRSEAGALLRPSAVMSLGRLARPDDPRSAEILVALLRARESAREPLERNLTAIALAQLAAADPAFDSPANRRPVTRALLEGFRGGDVSHRSWCGLALGVQAFLLAERGLAAPQVSAELLLEQFDETSAPEPRAAFAIGLGLMGNPAAAASLRAAMDDSRDAEFLGYASVALGLLGAREHADALVALVETRKREPELLRQAAIGLGLMREPAAQARLLDYLHPAQGRPPLSVLASAAIGLGFVGDAGAVSPLVQALKDTRRTPLGRAFAAVALGLVADRNLLPWHAPIGEDLNYRASVPTLLDPSTACGILDLL